MGTTLKTSDGYICPHCGGWVYYGGTHACPGQQTYYVPISQLVTFDSETMAVLKRIADALEKIAK